MQNVLLVRFGEVFLKGQNRSFFMNTLQRNIRQSLHGMEAKVEAAQGRFFVRADDIGEAARRVCRVFGVHSVSPAVECGKGLEEIYAQAIALMQSKQGSFKVSSRRSDKTFPMDSMELSRQVGGAILEALPHLTVDVHTPDHTLEVEIREQTYLHVEKQAAVGGMPVGTGGKAALLLSGGIDSPVSGYMIAKRGVVLEAVHFHSFPFTSEQAKEKVVDLAKILSGFCGNIRLHVVPFTQLQKVMHEQCPDAQLTIIMRRAMMRIAERIAQKHHCGALITGESLGQVASQTMASLQCTGSVCTLPIFRPLIGMDKVEIIQIAQQIGTYETSILPYEDCCTVFTPRHPNTKPQIARIEQSEAAIDWEPMYQEAIDGVEIIEI